MNPENMKKRTRAFALRVIRLAESLPNTPTANTIRNQMRSVAANYRAACRARSKADFASKMGIVEEEADESLFRIELLIDAGVINRQRVSDLLTEADEILAITVSSIKTSRGFPRARL